MLLGANPCHALQLSWFGMSSAMIGARRANLSDALGVGVGGLGGGGCVGCWRKGNHRGDGSDRLDLSLEGFDFIRTGSAAGKVRRTLSLSDFFEVWK